MKQAYGRYLPGHALVVLILISMLGACDRSSSPEGRMSIKVESLQREMMDSLRNQHKAILDSLGKIREELNQMKQHK